MPTYNYLSFAQAQAQLAGNLFQSAIDPTQQFWSLSEIGNYIIESLQTWNALTSFWRIEYVYNPSTTVYFTDITANNSSPRAMTTTDLALIEQIETILLEPQTAAYPLTWTGSNQYSVSQILNALQGTRDELLGITGCTLTRSLLGAPIQAEVPLGQNTIDLRRAAWFPSDANFTNSPMRQADDFELQSFAPLYTANNSGIPYTWRKSAQPPLNFYVDNIPAVPGNYETLTVEAGAPLSASNSTVLPIPNDWCWVLKFGALAELFDNEALAKDPLRAQYCAKRYADGLKILTNATAVLAARINNIPVAPDSVRNADDFNPNWENNSTGNTASIYTAGLNLVAHSPLPSGANTASVTLQVVRNAPVPANMGDFIQLSKDDLQACLDYAQHLAMLKSGGAEFMATMPMLQSFFERVALYNSKLKELGNFSIQMQETSQLEAERNPVYQKGQTPAEVLT